LRKPHGTIPISCLILQEKEYHTSLGIDDFQCSDGWFHGFKHCYDAVLCDQWCKGGRHNRSMDYHLPQLLREYHPNNIFNANKSGFFYKLLPNKSLIPKGNSCHGGKRSKERLIILPCAIQNVASQQQFNSKNQSVCKIINENVEIKDEINYWFSSSNQTLGIHLLRVLIKQDYFHQLSLIHWYHYNEMNSQSP